MFKADGTPIRDPAAYVAKMGGPEDYDGDLKDQNGQTIKDPVAYVMKMGLDSEVSRPKARRSAHFSGGRPDALYKEDGTEIRDPAAYVAGMKGDYKGGLFNGKGEEIRDPQAYVKNIGGAGFGSIVRVPPLPSPRASPRVGFFVLGSRNDDGALYKADGTPVRDPVAYITGMERKPGGYQGGLFNGKGVEIRDPQAYLKGMTGGGRRPGLPVPSGPGRVPAFSNNALFKEDGTMIRDPKAYVARIEKEGYQGGIFNDKGV